MRSPVDRWTKVAMLLSGTERVAEQVARLDAYGRVNMYKRGAEVDVQIARLNAQLLKEMNRVTVERLTIDLERKKRAAA